MSSVGVFVDAGYLFAQGSAALTGSQKPRTSLLLNETAVAAELSSLAHEKSGGARLLRIYWYDAARSWHSLGLDHTKLAHTDHIKLRLGFMNSQKQQKGVDSLIVTDLIELARNHAMTDAVLLSGDEDVRIGVQIAQSFGVRIHLLGIKPCRGSQSLQLMQEADTTSEWDNQVIGKFLAVPANIISPASQAPAGTNAKPLPSKATPSRLPQADQLVTKQFAAVAEALLASLDSSDVDAISFFWASQKGLPPGIDGKLLARCRDEIKRPLEPHEKRSVRAQFTTLIKAKLPSE
jgi:uncharacterized LabA/DUF88 family protein